MMIATYVGFSSGVRRANVFLPIQSCVFGRGAVVSVLKTLSNKDLQKNNLCNYGFG